MKGSKEQYYKHCPQVLRHHCRIRLEGFSKTDVLSAIISCEDEVLASTTKCYWQATSMVVPFDAVREMLRKVPSRTKLRLKVYRQSITAECLLEQDFYFVSGFISEIVHQGETKELETKQEVVKQKAPKRKAYSAFSKHPFSKHHLHYSSSSSVSSSDPESFSSSDQDKSCKQNDQDSASDQDFYKSESNPTMWQPLLDSDTDAERIMKQLAMPRALLYYTENAMGEVQIMHSRLYAEQLTHPIPWEPAPLPGFSRLILNTGTLRRP